MARPLKSPEKKAVQATVRLTPAAWARIDELRKPGQTRASVIEAIVWRDAQGSLPLVDDSDGSNKRSIQERRKDAGDALIAAVEKVGLDAKPLVAQEVRGTLPGMDCPHRTSTTIGAGMRRCEACGAVRGAGGVWRQP